MQVLAILDEYYVNGDIQDAATTLQVRFVVLYTVVDSALRCCFEAHAICLRVRAAMTHMAIV